MKIGYFDCVSGVSGDMILGSLVACGVPENVLQKEITKLQLSGCKLSFQKVKKNEITAVQALVVTPRKGPSRSLYDLLSIVDRSRLDNELKSKTEKCLKRIAKIESEIHGLPMESMHLHELGGDDTLIDIVGTFCGISYLKLEAVYCSSIPLAGGWVESLHGKLPLPAPATLNLLKNAVVHKVDFNAELVTPTGALLLTELADQFGEFPQMRLKKVGVGAGKKDFPFPDILRLWIGETEAVPSGLVKEKLAVVETNIDDMNPQIFKYVSDKLFDEGALDVSLTPTQMKKGRPGIILGVICKTQDVDEIILTILEETTSLGVRTYEVDRFSVERVIKKIKTPYGIVGAKFFPWRNKLSFSLEYDDCVKLAKKHKIPLNQVMSSIKESIRT